MTCGRIFAIRFGKFIELRAAKTPPKAVVSHTTYKTTYKDEVYSWNDKTMHFEYKTITKPYDIPLTQTIYEGGRYLGTLSYRKFRDLGGPNIRANKMTELNSELVQVFLERRKELI